MGCSSLERWYDTKCLCPVQAQNSAHKVDNVISHRINIYPLNGLETKISRTFLDLLHLGHGFFVMSGHGT